MKLVFLAYLHGFGGAEKQIVMLANEMADRGHDVTLISICVDNNCYRTSDAVKYRSLPDRRKGVLRIATRYIDIRLALKEIKPDFTISFWFQSAYLTALMRKSITGKVVYSERGDPGDKEYSGILGLIRSVVLPRIDAFVFQSNAAKCYFGTKVQARGVVISNPILVDTAYSVDPMNRRKVIVTVGRLHPQKNQRLLIDAFSLIESRISDYSLEIYGDGDLKNDLKHHIDELNLTDRVILKGASSRIHEYIHDASLFVLSSDYEGLPNTLLEAMALGIPVITTDYKPGGASEIIEHGVNGWIVRRGDTKGLANLMLHAINDRNNSFRIGKKGKEAVSEFTPTHVYDKWERLLESLLGSK